MAIFAIYRYKIRQSTDRQLRIELNDSDNHITYDTPYDIFESFLGKANQPLSGIARLKERGKGKNKVSEWDSHATMVEQHLNHIIVFLLQANKTKTINQENWKTKKEPHHPDCRVIIDNRPNSHLMIIQRKTTTFSDPDNAMELLENSFNRWLLDYGLGMKFSRLSKKESFWNAVNEIRDNFNDKVERVQFDFKSDAQREDDGSFTYKLMRWANQFAESSGLTMTIGDDKRLKLVEKDLTYMSELCYHNQNYNLMVKFRDFGLYRYGQDIKAQYGMDENIIDNFVALEQNSKPIYLFEETNDDNSLDKLTKWFDRVNKLFEEYDKNKIVDKKRNNDGRA